MSSWLMFGYIYLSRPLKSLKTNRSEDASTLWMNNPQCTCTHTEDIYTHTQYTLLCVKGSKKVWPQQIWGIKWCIILTGREVMLLQDKSTTVALVNKACYKSHQESVRLHTVNTDTSRDAMNVELTSNSPALWLAPRWGHTGSGPLHYRWFYPSGSTLCCFYSFWCLGWSLCRRWEDMLQI